MDRHEIVAAFEGERATTYDSQWEKLAPIVEALYLLMRIVMAGVPARGRVLCVGVGTGSELIALGQAFPGWSFTGVDPSADMLAVCRQRIEDAGLASRCALHHGFLESLPETEPFDAATCLLVSHFLIDATARRGLFEEIAKRLRPGGLLVNADLAMYRSEPTYDDLLGAWAGLLRQRTQLDDDAVEKYAAMLGRDVAAHTPREVEALIAEAGFRAPVQFYQAVLIRAWFARRAG